VKVGDLVTMPGETLRDNEPQSIGLIVEDVNPQRPGFRKRIGVMWVDGGGVVDYEPKEWLAVLSSCSSSSGMV
jgi:hypothetical protein